MARSRFCFLGCLALVALAGCSREPFQHVQVSGSVTYDDGSVIPVDLMELTFQPQTPPVDERTHPRPGHVGVEVATGKFSKATTRKLGDGVIAGKHKVKITAYDASQQVSKAIPAEYLDLRTTPLEFDTDNPVWEIRIKRPAGSPSR